MGRWVLKGEGKIGAVFCSLEDSAMVGKVLRVSKAAGTSSATDLELEVWRALPGLTTKDDHIRRESYPDLVLRPHLGGLMGGYETVNLSRELQEELLEQLRHVGRQPPPPSLQESALIMPDYTIVVTQTAPTSDSAQRGCQLQLQLHLPMQILKRSAEAAVTDQASNLDLSGQSGEDLCIEIKPKCGFLPNSGAIPSAHAIKRTRSRFYLHQQLKLSKGEVCRMSKYEPLDLFSGNAQQIQQAISFLLEEPQNNLKVFIGGSPVTVESLEDSLPRILPFPGSVDSSLFIPQLASQALLKSGVLDKVLELQRLDKHDIEGVYPIYQSMLHASSAEQTAQPFQQTEDSAAVQAVRSLCELPYEAKLDILRDYLTAATAKDCSIMIACRVCKSMKKDCIEARCSIRIADLDLKPLSKLTDHYVLDQAIVTFALDVNAIEGP